jgi:sugar phosphate isomerase/epimerase
MVIIKNSSEKCPTFKTRIYSELSRRNFIKKSITALGGVMALTSSTPLLAELGQIGFLEKKIRVGGHPWVYAATLEGHDITPVLEQIFLDMKYAGLDGVELMHHPLRKKESVQQIDELSEHYNMPVIGSSYEAKMWDRNQHNAILEDAEMVLSNLKKVGGRTFGVSVGKAPAQKTEKQLDDQAELLLKIRKIAESNGVTLNLHNHTYEVENEMHDLKGTLKRIPDAKLGPDLNWLVRAGVDPVEFINTYGSQIVLIHLRDQHKNGRWSEALGDGNMDFAGIGKALKKNGFSGDAIIELAHEKDFQITRSIRSSLKKSREHIKKTMKV